MCGRVDLHTPAQEIALHFEAVWGESAAQFVPGWNIAPSRPLLLVTQDGGERRLQSAVWGLLPHWAKDTTMARPINARGESVAEKPMFRDAFRKTRCLIPIDGFYEWHREGAAKQPWYFHMRELEPFALAGLLSHWRGGTDQQLDSCAVITTSANSVMAPVHERMPVIVARADWGAWLSGETAPARDLLRPFACEGLVAERVSRRVNRASNDGPDLIEPID